VRDIPMFTTPFGAAGLVLCEISYQAAAYVHIHYTDDIDALLGECVSFCRAAGAQRIYAKGHTALESYPLYTTILKMQCDKSQLPDTEACLFPVTEQTLAQWLQIYRQKIRKVPNGAWMTDADGERMLAAGEGYYIHRDGELLGIGRVKGNELQWVASVKKDAGRDIVLALAHCVAEDELWLTVSRENEKAMKLYSGLGFIVTQELSRWYQIF